MLARQRLSWHAPSLGWKALLWLVAHVAFAVLAAAAAAAAAITLVDGAAPASVVVTPVGVAVAAATAVTFHVIGAVALPNMTHARQNAHEPALSRDGLDTAAGGEWVIWSRQRVGWEGVGSSHMQ